MQLHIPRHNGEVTKAGDTFERFVGSLAANLDDHAARGEDLAARLHLSRFHFDRVIAAASGETPDAFRRRVLLERAAYRLTSAQARVIDVAMEAGYASNEAFTRAFRRAYGISPSEWRASPRPTALPTPNAVHFYPPGGLRLPASEKVTSMDLTLKMVDHHVWLLGQILERVERLTDEQLDQPIVLSVDGVDDDPSIRSLTSRLIGQLDMWNASMEGRRYEFDVERHEGVASMRARLAHAGPTFAERVHKVVADSALADTFVDATCEPARVFTYGGIVAHVLTFAAHRRTLVIGALASAGIDDLNSGDPLVWVTA